MRTVCSTKARNKFQTFEGKLYFSPDLRQKQFTYKISKERIAIASAVGLDNLSSNLRIFILGLITKFVFKYKCPESEELFNLYVCLTTVGEMNATNLKSVMKNQDIKDSFFKI